MRVAQRVPLRAEFVPPHTVAKVQLAIIYLLNCPICHPNTGTIIGGGSFGAAAYAAHEQAAFAYGAVRALAFFVFNCYMIHMLTRSFFGLGSFAFASAMSSARMPAKVSMLSAMTCHVCGYCLV